MNMRTLSRVVWSEGMHLAQHHFQAQSRYFEDLIGFTLCTLFFEHYGVASLDLDPEALFNGTVSVTHARGIMPDGLVFQFPEDPVPEPLEIRERFSPTQDSHLVLLGVQPYRPRQPNCAFETNGAGPDVRFTSEARPIPDETTGQDDRPVAVARKNFRLLLDTEVTEDLVCLPIARVRRDGSGHFIYDPDYVPPCIRIGASSRLMQLLARLVETLDAKADAIIAQRQGARTSMADYAAREVADFWLSHTIHSSLPPLRHLLQARSGHPEALFSELSRLAGALCTFSLQSDPRSLPLYDHRDLDRCFTALERHVREHLEVVLPTRSITVALQRASAEELEASSAIDPEMLEAYRDFLVRASPYFYLGAVTDRRCFDHGLWFLGVRSSARHGDIVTRVPTLVKVCSAKHIARLVKDAYPGITLEHVPAPPSQISPRPDTLYFRLQMEGGCWTSIVQTGRVGIYVPAAIADAELDLSVVPGQ
jgi:type VI secretion system protein ImpJ